MNVNTLVTSASEDMFSLICAVSQQNYSKTTEQISRRICGGMKHDPYSVYKCADPDYLIPPTTFFFFFNGSFETLTLHTETKP